MSIEADCRLAAVKLSHSGTRGEPDYFVLVRMDTTHHAEPVDLAIDGAVLADSTSPDQTSASMTPTRLFTMQAIVGCGSVRIVDA